MLALLFIGLPLLELVLLLQIGDVIGGWNTIALIFVTGIVGVTLAKAEGLRMLTEIREQLNQGQLPEESLLSGLLLVIGGAFLLTPGVLTDVFGLSMLVAPVRRALAGRLRHRFAGQLQSGVTPGAGFSMGANFVGNFGGESPFADAPGQAGNGNGEVIDVEVVVDAQQTNDVRNNDTSLMRE